MQAIADIMPSKCLSNRSSANPLWMYSPHWARPPPLLVTSLAAGIARPDAATDSAVNSSNVDVLRRTDIVAVRDER